MILGLAHLAIEVDDIERSIAELATAGWRATVLAHGVTLPPLGSDGYPSDAASLDLAVLSAGESVVALELTTHASPTRSIGHYALVLGPSAPRVGSNAPALADVVAGHDVAAAHSADWAAPAFAEAVPDAAATSAFWRALVRARVVAEGAGWSRLRLFAPFRTAAADLLVVSGGDDAAEHRARIDGRGAAALAFLSTDIARDLAVAEDAGAVVLASPGTMAVAGRRFEVAFFEAPGGGCVELMWPLDDGRDEVLC